MALSLRPLPWPEWRCAGAEKRPRATNPPATVLTLGALAMAALLPGPMRLGGITLDVHSLLYASGAVVMGFQAMQFWVFARAYGAVTGLLPEPRSLSRFGLEAALVVAGVLLLLGLGLFLGKPRQPLRLAPA